MPIEYNWRQYSKTKHSYFNQKYSVQFRKQKITSLIQAMEVHQNILKKRSASSEQATEFV